MTRAKRLLTATGISAIVGVLFAGLSTDIPYSPCPSPPMDLGAAYVSYEKALLHSSDLADNYQGSLTRFIVNFLLGFVVSFALLWVCSWVLSRRSNH